MSRRNIDERRDEYLDIGTQILAEAASGKSGQPALAMAHVKVADVARRANVTKGALYHIWDSQEDFWQDLLERLLESTTMSHSPYLHEVAARLNELQKDHLTIVDYADAMFRTMTESSAFFARVGLFSYLNDEYVAGRLDEEFKAQIAAFAEPLQLAIAAAGRRWRNDVSITSVLVSLSALLEGLCLQHRISPERTPRVPMSDGSDVSLFAVASEAILLAATQPIDGEPEETNDLGVLSHIGLQVPLGLEGS